MSTPLSIILATQDHAHARAINKGLLSSGDHRIQSVSEPKALTKLIAQSEPDVVLIDGTNDSWAMVEMLINAAGPMDRPVALFVDRNKDGLARTVIEAGVSAYVVDGIHSGRIDSILDAAIARFQMFQRLRGELETSKQSLKDRKLTDRAKGLLMKAHNINEDQAYALLRKAAMDQGRKVVDVAAALVTAAELLG